MELLLKYGFLKFLQKKAVEHKKKFEVLQTINYPINKRYAKYHKYGIFFFFYRVKIFFLP